MGLTSVNKDLANFSLSQKYMKIKNRRMEHLPKLVSDILCGYTVFHYKNTFFPNKLGIKQKKYGTSRMFWLEIKGPKTWKKICGYLINLGLNKSPFVKSI